MDRKTTAGPFVDDDWGVAPPEEWESGNIEVHDAYGRVCAVFGEVDDPVTMERARLIASAPSISAALNSVPVVGEGHPEVPSVGSTGTLSAPALDLAGENERLMAALSECHDGLHPDQRACEFMRCRFWLILTEKARAALAKSAETSRGAR